MKNIIFGNSMDVMPSAFFRIMSALFKVRDLLMPHDYKLDLMGIKEGDVVLDPFLGSGTTAIAAQNLKRNWIGIEANCDYCELARYRIENDLNSNNKDTTARKE